MKKCYLLLLTAFFGVCSLTGQSLVVTVNTPGTLDDEITGQIFTNLIVNGTIDSTDFVTMKNKNGLHNIDLSGATVVNNRIPNDAFLFRFFLESIILPPTVTTIGSGAFISCSNLTEITFPSSLKFIGHAAFFGCSSLLEVQFPASLEKISTLSFNSCALLTEIHIPANVSGIGYDAFGQTKITAFTVDASNQHYSALDGVLFNKNKTYLVSYPAAKSGSVYEIPSTVDTVGFNAFDNPKHLSEVTIPASVKDLSVRPFYASDSISAFTVAADNLNYSSSEGVLFNKNKSILIKSPVLNSNEYIIPASVKYISEYAFLLNKNLTGVILPKGLDSIGNNAFTSCINITTLELPENLKAIHQSAFSGCKKLERLIIPMAIDSLPVDVTAGCTNLKTIILPSNVHYFFYTNLNNCTNIDSIWTNSANPIDVPAPFDFYSIDTINSTLFVPEGALAAYKSHSFWKHFPTTEIDYFLDISDNAETVAAEGTENTLSILSNTEWTVTASQDWIHVHKLKGMFNGDIGFTIDANAGVSRQGNITVSGLGVDPSVLAITQSGITSAVDDIDLNTLKIQLGPDKNYLWITNAAGEKVIVYNVLGECMYMNNIGSAHEEIDIQSLPSGYYVVKVGNHRVKISK